MRRRFCTGGRAGLPVIASLVLLSSVATAFAGSADAAWKAGFSRVVITPDEPMWMSGYGARTKPSEEKPMLDLCARVAALKDSSGTLSLVVSLDLIGIHPEMAAEVARAAEEKHQVARKHILFAASHTHCGPALDDKLTHMLDMKEDDWTAVRKYQKVLNAKLIGAIDQAVADLKPAKVAFGHGRAGFAANRRPPINVGPYDHDVPVLRISGEDGALRGVIYGYACHATVMSFYQWSGDYPGFASRYVEEKHPKSVALFAAGCGADQNPLPRRKQELAEKYGRLLGVAVDEALKQKLTPVSGPIRAAFQTTDLPFDELPTRDDLEKDKAGADRYKRVRATLLLEELAQNGKLAAAYPYPVQVWNVGGTFTWAALGGEVVVDYSLRLKKELGPERTWVTGYANDVMAYIPSERVLKEGGYEGASSMIVYQKPASWRPGLEDQIVSTVRALADSLKASAGAK